MTDQEINVAIAEFLGRKFHKPTEEEITSGSYYQYEPNFCSDLNAMHEAEKAVPDEHKYERLLKWVCDHDWQHATVKTKRNPIYATSLQRAEAFLRTVRKWKP